MRPRFGHRTQRGHVTRARPAKQQRRHCRKFGRRSCSEDDGVKQIEHHADLEIDFPASRLRYVWVARVDDRPVQHPATSGECSMDQANSISTASRTVSDDAEPPAHGRPAASRSRRNWPAGRDHRKGSTSARMELEEPVVHASPTRRRERLERSRARRWTRCVGRHVGQYRVESLLGRGSMATCSRRGISVWHVIVLEVMDPRCSLRISRGFRSSSGADAHPAAATLVHPHVVTIHNLGSLDGLHFFRWSMSPVV